MLGAEVIANFLSEKGLDKLYVYPGGTIAPILDAAIKKDIKIFCARHEQGAGYAALAAAKIEHKPQVVLVTSGPGVTNIATVAGDAYFDSAPLLILSGQVGTGDLCCGTDLRQRGFQEVDAVSILKPLTKKQFIVKNTDDVLSVMNQAWFIANSGRPGPVLVDLPMNIQRGEIENHQNVVSPEETFCGIDGRKIDQLVSWLSEAKKPLVIAGQGVILSQAHDELRKFIDYCKIPVSHSLLGLGAYPTNLPLSLGFHGHTGNQYAAKAIHECDLLIAIGTRLDVRQTGSCFDKFVAKGRVVRIDIDKTELEHARVKTDLIIHADAKLTLQKINLVLQGKRFPKLDDWHNQIMVWRQKYPLMVKENETLKPQQVVMKVNSLTKGKSVICTTGVGSHQHWVARHFDFDYPKRILLTSGGHGAMGFDLPVAIGAQVTRPDSTVICFNGDGSFQMNIQELATIAEKGLPVKIIILDNNRLAMVSQFQKLNWNDDPTCGNKWNPAFAAIGQAYGIESYSVKSISELDKILGNALESDKPCLVHCHVDPDEDVVPMLLGGQTMDRMWPYES